MGCTSRTRGLFAGIKGPDSILSPHHRSSCFAETDISLCMCHAVPVRRGWFVAQGTVRTLRLESSSDILASDEEKRSPNFDLPRMPPVKLRYTSGHKEASQRALSGIGRAALVTQRGVDPLLRRCAYFKMRESRNQADV